MKRFTIWLILGLIFIVGIIYFAFKSDKVISVTYIRFNINPSFIIGFNDKDVVKIYNPMNEDAKIFNLSMFNNKSLDNVMKIILQKLDDNNYLDDKKLEMIVISKNPSKINYYYNKVLSVVKEHDSNLELSMSDASYDLLYAYSNEVAYDVKNSLSDDDLVMIANNIYDYVKKYVDNKINDLSMDNLVDTDKLILLKAKLDDGYFLMDEENSYKDNYVNYKDYSYTILFNEDLSYDISLDIKVNYLSTLEKKNKVYTVIEEYNFIYENQELKGLKTNFYKYI